MIMKTAKEFNPVTQTCLTYFGKMTASATHELKNSLSIINENAGLLTDLVAMAQSRKTNLSCERILRLSQALNRQVLRIDDILKKLNRFSHTVDSDFETIDIEDTVKLVAGMASRLIDMKGVSVKICCESGPVFLNTRYFLLETAIWIAIETASDHAGTSKTITVEILGTPSPSIWFGTEQPFDKQLLASKTDIRLMEHIGATLKLESDKFRFGFVWPNQK